MNISFQKISTTSIFLLIQLLPLKVISQHLNQGSFIKICVSVQDTSNQPIPNIEVRSIDGISKFTDQEQGLVYFFWPRDKFPGLNQNLFQVQLENSNWEVLNIAIPFLKLTDTINVTITLLKNRKARLSPGLYITQMFNPPICCDSSTTTIYLKPVGPDTFYIDGIKIKQRFLFCHGYGLYGLNIPFIEIPIKQLCFFYPINGDTLIPFNTSVIVLFEKEGFETPLSITLIPEGVYSTACLFSLHLLEADLLYHTSSGFRGSININKPNSNGVFLAKSMDCDIITTPHWFVGQSDFASRNSEFPYYFYPTPFGQNSSFQVLSPQGYVKGVDESSKSFSLLPKPYNPIFLDSLERKLRDGEKIDLNIPGETIAHSGFELPFSKNSIQNLKLNPYTLLYLYAFNDIPLELPVFYNLSEPPEDEFEELVDVYVRYPDFRDWFNNFYISLSLHHSTFRDDDLVKLLSMGGLDSLFLSWPNKTYLRYLPFFRTYDGNTELGRSNIFSQLILNKVPGYTDAIYSQLHKDRLGLHAAYLVRDSFSTSQILEICDSICVKDIDEFHCQRFFLTYRSNVEFENSVQDSTPYFYPGLKLICDSLNVGIDYDFFRILPTENPDTIFKLETSKYFFRNKVFPAYEFRRFFISDIDTAGLKNICSYADREGKINSLIKIVESTKNSWAVALMVLAFSKSKESNSFLAGQLLIKSRHRIAMNSLMINCLLQPVDSLESFVKCVFWQYIGGLSEEFNETLINRHPISSGKNWLNLYLLLASNQNGSFGYRAPMSRINENRNLVSKSEFKILRTFWKKRILMDDFRYYLMDENWLKNFTDWLKINRVPAQWSKK